MNHPGRCFALFLSVLALSASTVAIVLYPGRGFVPSRALPVGTNTPEGAACDYVRAFLAVDPSLFAQTRAATGCETPGDVTRSFQRFMDQKSETRRLVGAASDKPYRIKSVSKPQRYALSACQQDGLNAYLNLNYGGHDCVFVDVVTSGSSGHDMVVRVELTNVNDNWKAVTESLLSIVQQSSAGNWLNCPS